jgi:hypothetical protein
MGRSAIPVDKWMDPHPLAMQPRSKLKDLYHEVWGENRRIFQGLDLVQPGDLILQFRNELTDLLAYAGRPCGRHAADRRLVASQSWMRISAKPATVRLIRHFDAL